MCTVIQTIIANNITSIISIIHSSLPTVLIILCVQMYKIEHSQIYLFELASHHAPQTMSATLLLSSEAQVAAAETEGEGDYSVYVNKMSRIFIKYIQNGTEAGKCSVFLLNRALECVSKKQFYYQWLIDHVFAPKIVHMQTIICFITSVFNNLREINMQVIQDTIFSKIHLISVLQFEHLVSSRKFAPLTIEIPLLTLQGSNIHNMKWKTEVDPYFVAYYLLHMALAIIYDKDSECYNSDGIIIYRKGDVMYSCQDKNRWLCTIFKGLGHQYLHTALNCIDARKKHVSKWIENEFIK